MKKMFKFLLSINLIWTLSIFPALAQAQTVPSVSEATNSFVKDFNSVVYSINEIPAILKDLDGYSRAAGQGITPNIAKDIYNRIDAALTLMTLILKDPKLTEDQKYEMAVKIAGAVGQLFITTFRHHGHDKVDTQKLMKKLSEMTKIDHAKEIFKEFFFDVTMPFSFAKTAEFKDPKDAELLKNPVVNQAKLATAKKVIRYAPAERMDRNEVSVQLAQLWGTKGREIHQMLEDGNLKSDFIGVLGTDADSVLNKTLRIREYRNTAQKWTAATYLGFAFWGFVFPHVDIVGPMTGQYNDNTHFMSSIVYLTVWLIAGITKYSITSSKVVQALKDALEIFKNPKSVLTQQLVVDGSANSSVGIRKTLVQRMREISNQIILTCKRAVGLK